MRFLSVPLWVILVGSFATAVELSDREQQMLRTIEATVRSAGTQFAAHNYVESSQSIRAAMRQIEIAAEEGSEEFHVRLQPAMDRIEKAHMMLEFEGITLPPFRRPRPSDIDSKRTESPAPSRASESTPNPEPSQDAPPMGAEEPIGAKEAMPDMESMPADAVSFRESVAPILANRCGRCHIASSKGGFNMATFAALMKGPAEGVVVFAGDTVGSRLIETIETGDMPRGGGKVPPAELQTLKTWILQGARDDGPDPNAPIAAGASPSPPSQPEVRRATGSETVSFANDVAPLLVSHCNGCHLDATQTRGGLSMETFARLLRGGDSGSAIVPGDGEGSLLVQKLRGTAGDRMPAGGRPALADESIALVSKWIDEGATLDGANPSQPLDVMSQLAWVASASAAEVTERRKGLADQHMRLVTASAEPTPSTDTNHFQVVGPASAGTLELVGAAAEAQMKAVHTVIPEQNVESLFHGRATIFVFPQRYAYSEFAKMVEGRGIPSDWSSHWQFDGIDAYVALVASEQDDEETIGQRLLAPLTSLAVATRGGDVPRWFAEGVGVATATRLRPTDRLAKRQAELETSRAVAAVESGKQFLEGKMTPEQADRIGVAIAGVLLERANRRKYNALIRHLEDGVAFDQAFSQSFGVPPEAFVDAWIRWVRGG